MDIYVVTTGEFDDYHVVAAYSDINEAFRYIKAHGTYSGEYIVTPVRVDAMKENR